MKKLAHNIFDTIDHSTKNEAIVRHWSVTDRIQIISKFSVKLMLYGLSKIGVVDLWRRAKRWAQPAPSACLTAEVVARRNGLLADRLASFLTRCGIPHTRSALDAVVERYAERFVEHPFSSLRGGTGFNNGLVLFALIACTRPSILIESGIWRGFTTYLMHHASPDDAKMTCFDINFRRIEWRSPKATYVCDDIVAIGYRPKGDGIRFAFFDDHVSHYERIVWALANDVDIVVVDDDIPAHCAHSDRHPPLPTAAMIFDPHQDVRLLRWIHEGILQSAEIDIPLRNDILAAYDYVPFPILTDITAQPAALIAVLLRKGLAERLSTTK